MAARGDDLLEELGHLGHVELGDRLLQPRRRHVRDSREATEPLWHVGRGVAERRELQVAHRLLVDHVEAPEREEQVRLHALTQGCVGQDESRVGHVEAALGADDREFAALGGLVAEVRDDGRCRVHARHVESSSLCVVVARSDAAVWLRETGDVGHLLGRLLGEELEELLGRDASGDGHAAQGRRLALGGEVLAQEVDRLPVLVRQLDADLGGQGLAHGLVPLARLREEALFVDVHLAAVDGRDGHRVHSSFLVILPAMDMWAGRGRGRPGRRTFQ